MNRFIILVSTKYIMHAWNGCMGALNLPLNLKSYLCFWMLKRERKRGGGVKGYQPEMCKYYS